MHGPPHKNPAEIGPANIVLEDLTQTQLYNKDLPVLQMLESFVSHCSNGITKSIILYSNYRNYAPPLDVKGGIITEKVFPVFSECFFWTCFGLVMYIWELMDVTERLALQM